MSRFVNERQSNWKRLEELLGKTEGVSGLRGLPRAEVRELGELYRRAATDLAIARAETRDAKLINYLNSLVIRSHGKIYRAEGQGMKLIRDFFTRDFPQTFRKNWRFIALAFGVKMAFAIVAFILVYNDLTFADAIGVGEVKYMAEGKIYWWRSLNDDNQLGSTLILVNNIRVSLLAFALGVSFCIGSLYILALNGLHIGGVLGVCYRVDPAFGNALVDFMVGHGFIELFCIYIVSGAGMAIGYAIINPGNLSRADALKKKGTEAARLVIGCALILILAGFIEGFLSPSNLPFWVKLGTGILTGTAMLAYLVLVGREKEAPLPI
jgi:uncharacterized membrane protein SpoIIM required for sporulation